MKALVLDASAAVEAALSKRGFALLSAYDLAAPPLLWSEGTSSLHELQWRGDVSRDLARLALDRLLEAPVRREAPAALAREAWVVADGLGWAKTCDAEYVALARILGCPLLTVDGRLKRIAGRLLEVVGPADL